MIQVTESANRTMAQLSGAVGDVQDVAREVRTGKGLVHNLVYEPDDGGLISELQELAATLTRIAREVDQGRGTLGGLIKDPTVYEDLKSALGNVERNVLFKALIRYTVKKDGLRRAEDAPTVNGAEQPKVARP